MQFRAADEWKSFEERFASGEWRSPIFRDMILADMRKLERGHSGLSIFYIGCGGGFDGEPEIQQSLAEISGQYIGVEPATDIGIGDWFTSVHRCLFEDAAIPSASIDLGFAVMVLEHLEAPKEFWGKVHEVLRPGGVSWGFTIDARHWFATASQLMEKLRLKDFYLDVLHGKRGEERYANYGVQYRSNTPEQLEPLTKAFGKRTIVNFRKVGSVDYYLPKGLRGISRLIDRYAIKRDWPGTLLCVRVEK